MAKQAGEGRSGRSERETEMAGLRGDPEWRQETYQPEAIGVQGVGHEVWGLPYSGQPQPSPCLVARTSGWAEAAGVLGP